jgi:lipopolysaccharide/colanic/teichoic acid biosynthesis glycosyltransferase
LAEGAEVNVFAAGRTTRDFNLVLQPPPVALDAGGERLKRAFDLAIACLVLALTLPLVGAIALLIKLTSPGPVFFRQTRVGRHGCHFEIVKFRTMVEAAETMKPKLCARSEADGLFKIREDPRLTPIGRVLRQTYLDELPQLLNVLGGEMSIVGPRPLIVEEDAAITGSGRRRLAVPPGMTGDWQLMRGGGGSLDEMIAADFRYVTEWSLWRDLRCLGRTALFMLGRKGW